LAEHKAIALDLATIPAEDPRTYAMIHKADTLGTFQIDIPCPDVDAAAHQAADLPRSFHRGRHRATRADGDMVHPYLRRREGKEEVVYPKPELEKVLGKTLGVPLFQEQAMRVAIEYDGFTPT